MPPIEPIGVPAGPLVGKRVVLGVSGGIAAYKAADLASHLVQQGVDLRVAMTEGATRFVGPMTFQAITRRPVFTGVFDGWGGDDAGHVTLASTADLVIVAPATATTIARLAAGMADDMLAATVLATAAPVVLAPAMEHHMWHHAATQANVATLRDRGVTIVTPESGRLASGASGDGRLATRERIVAAARGVLAHGGPLAGRRVVVTAGGTHEAIDPVRFLGNRSSGRMGVAMAEAAFDLGAKVITIAGPTVVMEPLTGTVVRVESAREMAEAVAAAVRDADALLMAAAVADFRPATTAPGKIKKGPGDDVPTLDLVRNPDILASIAPTRLVKIGFAAETDDLVENASSKLHAKGLDLIVANDAVATIGSSTAQVTLLHRDGTVQALPGMTKSEVARVIVQRVATLLEGRDLARP